jgi:glycosyltransferase involved in cell wall biosynthesis
VRVAFLTQDLQLSGGVGVIVEHASRLAVEHHFDVTLVHTGQREDREWRFRGLKDLHVLPLAEAAQRRYDVAVSTWWETARSLFQLPADRYASFVQSLEDRFYQPWEPERIAAAMSLDLPVRFITEARWIAQALDDLQPGTRALYVRNGIAKDVFRLPTEIVPALSGPLRIVIEGSRSIPFKGVDDALDAVRRMREPRHVTVVSPDGSADSGLDADLVLASLTPKQMAALYGESHVVLKLSRVEGMSGPPLEGFHRGATCVVTPVTGHDEYVVHGHNALVVDWDDPRGTARALDLLARDRERLQYLRVNALATARTWPSWHQQSMVMAAALRTIRRDPPPPPAAVGHRIVNDLDASLGHAQRQLLSYNAVLAQLEEIRGLRAFRWGVGVRDAALTVVGPVRGLVRRLRRLP